MNDTFLEVSDHRISLMQEGIGGVFTFCYVQILGVWVRATFRFRR